MPHMSQMRWLVLSTQREKGDGGVFGSLCKEQINERGSFVLGNVCPEAAMARVECENSMNQRLRIREFVLPNLPHLVAAFNRNQEVENLCVEHTSEHLKD